MAAVGAIASARRAVGLVIRIGSALLTAALIVVNGRSPADAQGAPAPPQSDQGVTAPGGSASPHVGAHWRMLHQRLRA